MKVCEYFVGSWFSAVNVGLRGLYRVLHVLLPSVLYNGYRVFPGGKERAGRDADPSPPSGAMVMKR